MKKVILAILAGFVLSIALSFSPVGDYIVKNKTAEVDQISGFYIFVNSTPVKEYKYIATIKCSGTWGSGQYQDIRNNLIKKARKKYPEGNGIIFYFYDGGTDKADIIKLKD